MSHDFWYEAGLAAAGLIFLVLLVLCAREGRPQSSGRHAAGPVCPCGCGRHPSEHTEMFLSYVPAQSRRSL